MGEYRQQPINRRHVLRWGAASVAATAAAAFTLRPTAARAATTTLLAADEFDGPADSAPNADIWRFDTGGGGWGNQELQTYTSSRKNAALDGNGNLVITARREADGSYTSARLKTQGTFTATYGRVKARIKVPRGQGIWPAFWMLGENIDAVGWPACGEIDIMENFGSEPATVHATVHGPGYSGAGGLTASFTTATGAAFADTFHVFAVDWKPDSITWLVDGTVRGVLRRADVGSRPWVFDKPFFVVLNVAVGGSWPGNPDVTTAMPQHMLVDWVRVFAN